MTGVTLKINFETSELRHALAKRKRRAEHLRPALTEIGEYLLEATEDRFKDQEDPAGRPWAPLSPGYKKRKRRQQDLILVLDGYLKGTLAKRVSAARLEISSNRVYAATHQLGDERNIPARGLSPRMRGNLSASLRREAWRGSIPTHAGKPPRRA